MLSPVATDAVMARTRMRRLTILFTSSVAFLAPSAVAPGLPALYADYAHVANAELLSRMVLTMPMLFVALSGPLVGLAVDRFGRRNTLLFSAFGYGVAGMSGLVLESLIAILVSRAFLGVFLAGVLTSVTALMGDYYTGDQRNKIAGMQGAFMSFGTLTFVVLAGLLAEIHWRAGFVLFAFAFLLIIPILLSLYEPEPNSPRRLDEPPEAQTGRAEWIVIAWIYVLVFVSMLALFMIPSQTQFFLIDIGVTDPTRAGLAIGIFNFSSGIASLFFPWLRRHFSTATIFALIFVDVAIGFVLIGTADNFMDVMIAMMVGGFSMGAFFPNANIVVISRTTAAVRGRALGGLAAALFLGQFVSPFYSLPLAGVSSLGGAFVITGYASFGLGALFVVLAIKSVIWGRRPS